jgi:ureidoacrylate peracid hydrolase
MAHDVEIRPEIKDRVRRRRGRLHFYDRLDPARTAHVVIDMQNVFVAPGAPIEVPAARGIVDRINETNAALRALGVKIVWVTHRNLRHGDHNDWALYYDHVVSPELARLALDWFHPEHDGSRIWSGLEVKPEDARFVKCRYSALIQGSSGLERYLRSNFIENLLISGTKTNVCCESTARDAMMLDFRTVMLSDCTAASSDDEHRATLENMIQGFADVMTGAQTLAVLKGHPLNE